MLGNRARVYLARGNAVRHDGCARTDEAQKAAQVAAADRALDAVGARVLRVGEDGTVVLPAAGLLARVIAGAGACEQARAWCRSATPRIPTARAFASPSTNGVRFCTVRSGEADL